MEIGWTGIISGILLIFLSRESNVGDSFSLFPAFDE